VVITLGQPEEVVLGNFAAGEVPDPVRYSFVDFFSNDIDLSAQTAIAFDFEKDGATAVHGAGAKALDPLVSPDLIQNTVSYTWAASDAGMTEGHYVGRFWVTLPNLLRASVKILWYVGSAVKGP